MTETSIAAFPLHRRRDLVERVADGLRSLQGEQANAFWRDIARELLAQLSASGVAADTAREEVRGLLYAALDDIQSGSVSA